MTGSGKRRAQNDPAPDNGADEPSLHLEQDDLPVKVKVPVHLPVDGALCHDPNLLRLLHK